MDNKHQVATKIKELIKFNENRKLATIWCNDMTNTQRKEEKKNYQKKTKSNEMKIVLGDDLNIVLDPKIDKQGGTMSKISYQLINLYVEEETIKDI
uniref:Uncharacterized protein n=1 Tax=Romanomermis culicivorax TaxID=13658 RepID=A0A915KQ53_ROMCU